MAKNQALIIVSATPATSLKAFLTWVCLLAPWVEVLTWSDFERNLGWTNFFVLASALSPGS